MIERPKVQYATNGGVSIAYSRFGRGDEVVVYVPPWVSNVELVWDIAEWARSLEFAGQHHQVIQFDKRGVGLSDRTGRPPTIDERVADTLAVLDAEGVDRAHMLGFSESGPPAIAIAGRFPERVSSLLLVGSAPPHPRVEEILPFVAEDDPQFDVMAQINEIIDTWGTDDCPMVDYFMSSAVGDERVRMWARRFERQSASPGALRAHLVSSLEMDVDEDLARITCPVFIGHARGDHAMPVAVGRYLAHRLPNATACIWESPDHNFSFSPNWSEIQADLIEFVTGMRPVVVERSRFGVVLFTDIANSTAGSINAGDDRWSRTIDAHDAIADEVIAGHSGRRVKSTGDGILAVFEDPVAAVDCTRRLLDRLGELGLPVRAGLHAGQVQIHDDGDITGTAVNIAARVESFARPGHLCVTRTIADLLLGEHTSFEPLGAHELKGIEQPIELFELADR